MPNVFGDVTKTIKQKVDFTKAGGAKSANALLFGIGTSANPALTSVASKSFMEFRTKSTATSGDSRSLYLRHELGGIGISGEAIRAFSKITAAAATCRGAHVSIDLATTGTVSGFGAGVDAQVLYGNTSYTSKLTALNVELYAAGASTAISAGSGSFFRCVIGGNATGLADISGNASFIDFSNAAGSGLMVDSDITALTGKAGLRVFVNGSLYGYIPIVSGS